MDSESLTMLLFSTFVFGYLVGICTEKWLAYKCRNKEAAK